MEKEYSVIVHRREDLPGIEAELTASSGAGPIPSRAVNVANQRPGSKIQTHFMLTDDEAEALRTDSRVRAVEIPPDQRDDLTIELRAYQDSNFYRGTLSLLSEVNWGLARCTKGINNYGNQRDWNFVKNNAPNTGQHEYGLDGTGVDIVIQDSGIQPDHPDFDNAKILFRRNCNPIYILTIFLIYTQRLTAKQIKQMFPNIGYIFV